MADQTIRAVFAADDKALMQALQQVQNELQGLRRNVKAANAEIGGQQAAVSGLAKVYGEFGAVGTRTTGGVLQQLLRFEQADGGLRKVGAGVSNLALSMVGLQGASGKVAEGLLMLGAGGTVTLALAAGLALAGGLYRTLTKEVREAGEQVEKLHETIQQQFDQSQPFRVQIQLDRADLERDLATLRKSLADNLALIATERTLFGGSLAELIDLITGTTKKQAGQIAQANQALAQLKVLQGDAGVRDLARLRDVGGARPEDLARLKSLRADLLAQQEALKRIAPTLGGQELLDNEQARVRIGQVLEDTAEKEATSKERTAKAVKEALAGEQQLAAEELKRQAKADFEAREAARHTLTLPGFDTSGRPLGDKSVPDFSSADDVQKKLVELSKQANATIGAVNQQALDAAVANIPAFTAKIKGPVFDLFGFVEQQGTQAFDSIFDAVIRGGQTAGEVIAGIFQNIASAIGHLFAEQLGRQAAELLVPKNQGTSTAGAAKLAAAGLTVSAGGAAVTAGATALAASAGPVVGAAAALTASAAAISAAAAALTIANSTSVGFASGGPVHGPGTGTSDSIPAYLSNGEFVVRARAVDYWGEDLLHAINRMQDLRVLTPNQFARRAVPGFATGGLIGKTAGSPPAASAHRLDVGLEDGLVLRQLESSDGRRALLRILRRERVAVKSQLGLGG